MTQPKRRPSSLLIGELRKGEGVRVTFPDGRMATVSFGASSSGSGSIAGLTIAYATGGRIRIDKGFDAQNGYDGTSTTIRADGNFPSAQQGMVDAVTLLRSPEL